MVCDAGQAVCRHDALYVDHCSSVVWSHRRLDGLCGDHADAHRERASVSGMARGGGSRCVTIWQKAMLLGKYEKVVSPKLNLSQFH